MNSDGHSSLFRPQLAPGQWWAIRKPVGLFQVIGIVEDGISGKLWDAMNPGVIWTFSTFYTADNEYLWFEVSFPSSLWFTNADREAPCFGQFYISVATERLFFIVPQDDPAQIKIRASWSVSEGAFQKSVLYQDIGLPQPIANNNEVYVRELLSDSFG